MMNSSALFQQASPSSSPSPGSSTVGDNRKVMATLREQQIRQLYMAETQSIKPNPTFTQFCYSLLHIAGIQYNLHCTRQL
jgi:hypothetical protein